MRHAQDVSMRCSAEVADPEGPLISVALCTYNAGEFLDQQLTSLLQQTYSPLEIVIADDGSTDGTWERLQEWADRSPLIRLLAQGLRLGFNANFRRCFEACHGVMISPCDQDDIWRPEKTTALFEASGRGRWAAFCDSEFIDAQDNPLAIKGRRSMCEPFIERGWRMPSPRAAAWRNEVSGHAMLFPAALLESLPPVPEDSYYDWWLVVWLRLQGVDVRFVPQSLVLYRRHPQAITLTQPVDNEARKRSKWRRRSQHMGLIAEVSSDPAHREMALRFRRAIEKKMAKGWSFELPWLIWQLRDELSPPPG